MGKILHVIKTVGIDYDERLQKNAATQVKFGHQPSFVALEKGNTSTRGTTTSGIPFETISLRTRSWFQQARGLLPKTLEMYCKFGRSILRSRAEIVWLHNIEMIGLVPLVFLLKRLGFVRQLVWDQHELPSDRLLYSTLPHAFFKFCLRLCDSIVVTNQERRDIFLAACGVEFAGKTNVVENLPDESFLHLPKGNLSDEVLKWLDGKPYLLVQGLVIRERRVLEAIEAAFAFEEFKVIVAGVVLQEGIIDDLKEQWGDRLADKVYFTGLLPYTEFNRYIDNAHACFIFYSFTNNNTKFCASNRFYQCIARGVPVITGANPPMAEVIKEFACGVSTEDDGAKVEGISAAIEKVKVDRENMRENALACRERFVWEKQERVFEKILSRQSMQ